MYLYTLSFDLVKSPAHWDLMVHFLGPIVDYQVWNLTEEIFPMACESSSYIKGKHLFKAAGDREGE